MAEAVLVPPPIPTLLLDLLLAVACWYPEVLAAVTTALPPDEKPRGPCPGGLTWRLPGRASRGDGHSPPALPPLIVLAASTVQLELRRRTDLWPLFVLLLVLAPVWRTFPPLPPLTRTRAPHGGAPIDLAAPQAAVSPFGLGGPWQ